ATIEWGDGGTSTGAITFAAGAFTVTGDYTYVEEGAYTVTTTIDHEGVLTTLTSTATVTDPPVVATGITINATEGLAFTGAAVATFIDPAGAEPNTSAHYSASIAWGDGATSVGAITFSAGVFTVSGNHTYGEEGSYGLTVAINHEGQI